MPIDYRTLQASTAAGSRGWEAIVAPSEDHPPEPSERVQLEFEGIGSGWFTIRLVVALPRVGAAAIA